MQRVRGRRREPTEAPPPRYHHTDTHQGRPLVNTFHSRTEPTWWPVAARNEFPWIVLRARHFYTSVGGTTCTSGLHVNVSPAMRTLRAPPGAIEFLIGETRRFNAMEDAVLRRTHSVLMLISVSVACKWSPALLNSIKAKANIPLTLFTGQFIRPVATQVAPIKGSVESEHLRMPLSLKG